MNKERTLLYELIAAFDVMDCETNIRLVYEPEDPTDNVLQDFYKLLSVCNNHLQTTKNCKICNFPLSHTRWKDGYEKCNTCSCNT